MYFFLKLKGCVELGTEALGGLTRESCNLFDGTYCRATVSSLVHPNIGSAESPQVHVVRDDDHAVLRHVNIELQHLGSALVDSASEALQCVLVGLGCSAAVGNVNITAAAPLLDCVDSETIVKQFIIRSKGFSNPARLATRFTQP